MRPVRMLVIGSLATMLVTSAAFAKTDVRAATTTLAAPAAVSPGSIDSRIAAKLQALAARLDALSKRLAQIAQRIEDRFNPASPGG